MGPSRSTTAPPQDETLKQMMLRWLLSQSFESVLLVAILGVLTAGGYYALQTAIPGHIAQTAEADKKRDERRVEEMRVMMNHHQSELTQILERMKADREMSAEQRQKDREQREKDRELIIRMWDTMTGVKSSALRPPKPQE